MTAGRAAQKFFAAALSYEGDDCLYWPYGRRRDGHGVIFRDGTMKSVSRLVCKHTNGDASLKYDSAHSCGNGHLGCCNPRHLSWKTRAENQADRVIHGTSNRGERCATAKLSEADVIAIRRLKGQLSQSQIARIYGVSNGTIQCIFSGRNWGWLENSTGG